MTDAANAMRSRAFVLVVLIGLLALVPATPASAVRRHCSATGDVCYGAFGTGTTVRLRITLAGNFFQRYTLCVRAPDATRACRRFRTHGAAHGLFQSSVRWSAHFPNRGPGRYRATWNGGGGAFSPAIAFNEGPTINATPASVRAGRRVRISGLAGGCPKGDQVTLLSRAFPHTHEFAGVPAVFATVRAGDRYAVRVRIPATRKAGRYAITARCGGGNFGVTAHLRVR
jgi:hypothetical protein